MSARNTSYNKKLRRLERLLTPGLPAYIDTVHYVMDRKHVSRRKALELLDAKKLTADGNPITGLHVPAALRDDLVLADG